MPDIQTTIVPHTQQPLVSRTYPTEAELDAAIAAAAAAQAQWAQVPLAERIAIGRRFIVRISASWHARTLISARRTSSRRPQTRSRSSSRCRWAGACASTL